MKIHAKSLIRLAVLLWIVFFASCHRAAVTDHPAGKQSPTAPTSASAEATALVCPPTYAELMRLDLAKPRRPSNVNHLRCDYPETSCVILRPCSGVAPAESSPFPLQLRCGAHPAGDSCPVAEPRPETPCAVPSDRSCFFRVGCDFTEYRCESGVWRCTMLGGGFPP